MYGATVARIDDESRVTVFVAVNNGQVAALDGDTGRVRWSASTGAGNRAGVAVGRLSAGARTVAIVATADGRLAVFDAGTGAVQRVLAGVGCGASRPLLVDTDGDGESEIVLGTSEGLLCASAGGRIHWRVGKGAVNASPVVTDLELDGHREVLFGTMTGELVCAELATGRVRWRWSNATRAPFESECAVADLDLDGVLDVVIAGHDRTLSALSGR
jgi:outer membrane protein assembly factor BamB